MFPLQTVAALTRAAGGRGYYSKHLVASAILQFYQDHGLFPDGLCRTTPSVIDWAGKMALGLTRVVACLICLGSFWAFLVNPLISRVPDSVKSLTFID